MRWHVLAIAIVALSGACKTELESTTPEADASTGAIADAQPAGADAMAAECAEGVPGCTCTDVPVGNGCTHSTNGGQYGHLACSGSYQCCNGDWKAGQGACGECACIEPTGMTGCSAEVECFPSFTGSASAIPEDIRTDMIGKSWHEGLGCPSLDDLSLLRFDHWGFDGMVHAGEMVVATSVADDILSAFRRLHEIGFPIERIERVDAYGGDDDASMAANNTSAFNCRAITGGSSLSEHSFGTALDINPVQNPYVNNGTVLPPSGSSYQDRSNAQPGMVLSGSSALDAFEDIGWIWGGTWSSLKDYQHFSVSGK